MKIGITEYGDAGRDLSWTEGIKKCDGAILVTKTITKSFGEILLKQEKPIILHCTCTGMGATNMEPGVYSPDRQLKALSHLIDKGFSRERIVLRVDPIYPSEYGIKLSKNVLGQALKMFGTDIRVRVSVMDMYPHSKRRLEQIGFDVDPIYHGKFYASEECLRCVADMLNKYPFHYELCAENTLFGFLNNADTNGCVSEKDLKIMGIDVPANIKINPQNRQGCHCLSCKYELLRPKASENCKVRDCVNRCIYCFWKR